MFRDVQLATGVRLRYAQAGAANGPAVLMLHGLSDSWFSFSPVLPLLPPDVCAIALDQRGHGDSERPDTGYAMDQLAEDALALMDALALSRAIVIGHSMGTFVARRLAVRAPHRVAHLVLLDGGPSGTNAILRGLKLAVDGLTDPVDPAFVREFQLSCVARAVAPAFIERVVTESLKLPARVWRGALAGMMDCPIAGALACPTTVIGGELDSVFSVAEQRELARLVGAHDVHVIPGVGHTPHWEVPDAVMTILSGILESVSIGK
jgi:pimeloyl-ACP methyl ester carboxylesterase